MKLPLWLQLAIAALTWGGLLPRVEAQNIHYGRVSDSTIIATLAPFWAQRDSIAHVCLMGSASPFSVDSLRATRENDHCERPGDVGAVAFLNGGGPEIAKDLPLLLIHRPDLVLVMAMVAPDCLYYAIRVLP